MRFAIGSGLAMGAGVAARAVRGKRGRLVRRRTHWEHATKGGGTGVLVALFAIPTAIALAFVILGFRRRPPSALWGIPGFAIYGLAVFSAYSILALGH